MKRRSRKGRMYLSEEKEQEEKDVPDIDLEKEQELKNRERCT